MMSGDLHIPLSPLCLHRHKDLCSFIIEEIRETNKPTCCFCLRTLKNYQSLKMHLNAVHIKAPVYTCKVCKTGWYDAARKRKCEVDHTGRWLCCVDDCAWSCRASRQAERKTHHMKVHGAADAFRRSPLFHFSTERASRLPPSFAPATVSLEEAQRRASKLEACFRDSKSVPTSLLAFARERHISLAGSAEKLLQLIPEYEEFCLPTPPPRAYSLAQAPSAKLRDRPYP